MLVLNLITSFVNYTTEFSAILFKCYKKFLVRIRVPAYKKLVILKSAGPFFCLIVFDIIYLN